MRLKNNKRYAVRVFCTGPPPASTPFLLLPGLPSNSLKSKPDWQEGLSRTILLSSPLLLNLVRGATTALREWCWHWCNGLNGKFSADVDVWIMKTFLSDFWQAGHFRELTDAVLLCVWSPLRLFSLFGFLFLISIGFLYSNLEHPRQAWSNSCIYFPKIIDL